MTGLKHIEIMKENTVRPYRFRPNFGAPGIPTRDRSTHGKKLEVDLNNTSNILSSNRTNMGVEPGKLLVLGIVGEAISPDIIENMIIKFNLSLVEETLSDTGNTNLMIQFPNMGTIDLFNQERELFQTDSNQEGILTYAQRRDLFNCIEIIRPITREDRMGSRLKISIDNAIPLPDGYFKVYIDVWHDGVKSRINEKESIIKQALGTVGSSLIGDLFEIPSMLLGIAMVNEFSLNALLNLDIIATVDFPFSNKLEEPYKLYTNDFIPIIEDNLDENAPLATILDSGVFAGNPLLSTVIVAEEDFDNTEHTTSDINGHGTGVAGIVVYGDIARSIESKIFAPLVRICNGKVMHDEGGCPYFCDDKRPEQIVSDAIKYFYEKYNCRVYNLSAGNKDYIYSGGRQFAWAEALDQLALILDIVIVVSAGNVSYPVINEFDSRDDLMSKCRDQLFTKEHRLIDPSTAALCVTVGSISRYEEPLTIPSRITSISAGRKDYPSVFTRIGKGINKAIKPEFVDYGGNFAIHQPIRGDSRWYGKDKNLMEPTLHNVVDKIFKGYCGTSFSAAHVTHIAARIEHALKEQMGEPPSANLIRSVLVNSAEYTTEMVEWAELSEDCLYTGKSNPKQERRLRLMGYGIASDNILYSDDNHVTLFSEDSLDLRSFHLYKIPVPKEFISIKAFKRISISLAYNPSTRLSRKEYLTNSLWFEVFRKIDEETLSMYKSKKDANADEVEDLEKFPDKYKADFTPGYQEISKSTLQQRVWTKGPGGGKDLLWDIDEPYIYVLVTGKARFKHADQAASQDYALVITFSYDSDEEIQLYNTLKNRVNIRERETQRSRIRV